MARDVTGIATRVFTAEHPAAICLQVGRPKDYDRVARFIEADVLETGKFDASFPKKSRKSPHAQASK